MDSNSRHLRKSGNALVHLEGSTSLKEIVPDILNHSVQTNITYYKSMSRSRLVGKGKKELKRIRNQETAALVGTAQPTILDPEEIREASDGGACEPQLSAEIDANPGPSADRSQSESPAPLTSQSGRRRKVPNYLRDYTH